MTPIIRMDPNGTFVISALIIGAIVGAVVGFGAATYVDYKDDGKIFNGSVEWYEYLGATVLEAGALISYIAPYLSSFMAQSWTFGSQVIMTASGEILTAVGITLTGAQVLTGVGSIGMIMAMARIGKSGGYRIDHHYPNDHNPPHVHISGDDGITRSDIFGNPLKGDRPMSPGEKKAFKKLLEKILKALMPWM